jgi:hypothetical protein
MRNVAVFIVVVVWRSAEDAGRKVAVQRSRHAKSFNPILGIKCLLHQIEMAE